MFNNIAYNAANGNALSRNSDATIIEASNYNNFITTGTNLIYNNNIGTFYTTLAAWQSATGFDANSLSINPLFVSATDLHCAQTALDSAGIYLPEVPDDIDGAVRDANYPDIGADEFTLLADDVGVSAILLPASGCALSAGELVKIRLQNYTAVPISGVDVAYRVGNGAPVIENIGGLVIPPGLSADYTFSATADLFVFGDYTLESWTLFGADVNPENDTANAVVQNVVQTVAPSNLLPTNATTNLSPYNIMFSWAPSAGTNTYDFYLWKQGLAQPATPTVANITQINLNYSIPNPEYGATYEWRMVAKNQYCFSASAVQTFTIVNLPDLIVQNVQIPATAFTGQPLSIGWEVRNTGPGGTGMSQWTDVIYLSEDQFFDVNTDIYFGGVSNFSALNANQSYVGNASFTIPNGFTGAYHVFVWTDRYNGMLETDENNNRAVSAGKVTVQLTPPPDLQVTAIIPPNNAFSGSAITVNYTVSNLGTGGTVSEDWQDRVYFGPNLSLNLGQATLLGYYTRTGNLSVAGSYSGAVTGTIPQGISGTYYVHVVTDYYNEEYEQANEGNNTAVSTPVSVTLTPPADLVVSSVTAPASATNLQQVSVSWVVENQGGSPANSYWYDQIFLSNIANNTSLAGAIGIASIARPQNLDLGESYTRSMTLTIPDDISGPYYFYVKTDAGNQVYEYTFESNNVKQAVASTAILTPDLAVSNILIGPNADSGDTILIQWTVQNTGTGKLNNRQVTDRILLSTNSTYAAGNFTALGELTGQLTLDPGASQNRQFHGVLPNGISGQYYIYVFSDAPTLVYENGSESNNVNANGTGLVVNLSPWVDLVPMSISVPGAANAGATIVVSYTVKNSGTAATQGQSWTDRVYLQSSPIWNPNGAQLVHTQSFNQNLAVDSVYTVATPVVLPLGLGSGNYYLFIVTDTDNKIYEHTGESNNQLGSSAINVVGYPPVDLAVNTVTVPASAMSGQTIQANWQVTNLAAVNTIALQWTDAVYLSTDSIYSPATDQQLATRPQSGPLAAGASYTASASVLLPNGIFGNYYLIVVTDIGGQNNDSALANNRRSSSVIPITLTPPPNLAVQSIMAPGQGFSGQSVQIVYQVRNSGVGQATGTWTDRVYLSTDFNLGGGDIMVGYRARSGGLAPGVTYTDTITANIPLSEFGNRILILKTDDNNVVYEYLSEGDNTASASIVLILPPPSDLVVQNIVAPVSALAGKGVNISWKVKNVGANPATGNMKEAVYFSVDTLWDGSDALLGSKNTGINLSPGASATQSLSADLVDVALGNYYVIVRTDLLNNINESNDNNNFLAHTPPVNVNVTLLPMNVLTPDTLLDAMPLYYRIEIPDSLAGASLLVQLRGDSLYAANELYLRYGQVPSRNNYDFGFSSILQANQEIIVPSLESGTYYLLAYGNTSVGTQQPITLFAKILDFEIREVTANQGGNNGLMTVRLDGAKFESGMDVRLERPGYSVPALCVIYQNPTRVYVQFDLRNRPLGLYDVVAEKTNAQTARLNDGFTIVPGGAAGLATNIIVPPSSRPNNVVTIKVEFVNNGNTDIINPVVQLVSMDSAPIALQTADLGLGLTTLNLPLSETGAPPGWLRPGAAGSVTVYVKATKAMSFLVKLPE
ncbi:MAG: hypothetical protein IPM98_06205 [Lewinellaceae bacterium]|nr:hypothetical protein [Lewinellaceae bacterium]